MLLRPHYHNSLRRYGIMFHPLVQYVYLLAAAVVFVVAVVVAVVVLF